jgi:hypothetical protein
MGREAWVKDEGGWLRRDRVVGYGLIGVGVLLMALIWPMVMNRMLGDVAWGAVTSEWIFRRMTLMSFFALVGMIGAVGHAVFFILAAIQGGFGVSKVARVGWALAVSMPLVFCVSMPAEVTPEGVQAWLYWCVWVMTFVSPVLLSVCMLIKARDARAYMWRQVWILGVCTLPFAVRVIFGPGLFSTGESGSALILRLWVEGLCLLLLVWSLALMWRYRGHYERMRALIASGRMCLGCGYDLTGTMAAGLRVCPECGRTAEAESLARAGSVQV